MLVLDTGDVPVRDRRALISDSITSATSASQMAFDGPPADLHLTLRQWEVGGVELVDATCSAHTLRRTRRRRSDEEPVLAATWGLKGHGVNVQDDHEVGVRPTGLWMTDLTEPHVHQVSDTRTVTAKLRLEALGLSERVARPALQHVGESPLLPLFTHHLTGVRRVADDVDGAAGLALGTSTLALARALVLSVSGDERLGRESLEDVLLPRVRAFVRDHLHDPDLDPATIAAAHHVSVRLLHRACAREGLRLEQWIIAQRLEGAHEELARLPHLRGAVGALAHRWGFRSASHFSRRFREAYGMTPVEWQATCRDGGR